MSSDKSVPPPAITPRVSVPRPDTVTGTATRPEPGPPPPPPARPTAARPPSGPVTSTSPAQDGAPADGAEQEMERESGEGRVAVARTGAVKAAAAALAAARSAAKKVSATVPAAPPEGHGPTAEDEDDDRTVDRMATTSATRPGSAASPTQGSPQGTMHYSAAGVAGTATAYPFAGPAAGGPATGATPSVRTPDGPRRVRLAVSRIDPWSAMKLGFLLAVAIGIMTVVATAVVWYVLDSMQVFVKIEDFVAEVAGSETNVDIQQFVGFGRVTSLATLLGVVNVVIITALSTIMAFLYNITASLVGGVHLTLTDD